MLEVDARTEFDKWVQEQMDDTTGRPEACDWMTWEKAWEVAANICGAIEDGALKKWHEEDRQNKHFWNGVASGAGECAAVLRGETDD